MSGPSLIQQTWEVEVEGVVHTVEIKVDLRLIAFELGRVAVASKGGYSQALNAAVKVKHVRRPPR